MSLQAHIEHIAHCHGVMGCALVEGATGMVITSAGQLPDIVRIGEAAVEFWRLHGRLNDYFSEEFGSLRRQAIFFDKLVLALFPWPHDTAWLLACVGRVGQVNWLELGQAIKTPPNDD